MTYKLYIGNKNYSSWSLRPWLLLKAFDLPFEEVQLKFDTEEFRRTVAQVAPNGKVPALQDGDIVVWDSLAIAEYLAEQHPRLWPSDLAARTMARCFCAEMHAGFSAVRNKMPMAVRARFPLKPEQDVAKDIARIEAMWTAARRRSKGAGEYLFGEFSIADAYFAPVVFRFQTYEVQLNGVATEYMHTMLDHPAMQAWAAAAETEPEIVKYDDPDYLYGKRA